ncbi:hypothetical protein BJF89_11575 [Corynebacterium sp. CNJ-954]|jgi:hypothetical protein|nr:hypothetical protein BJF89_11575 [Corynebacterium sp. CNJ-954]
MVHRIPGDGRPVAVALGAFTGSGEGFQGRKMAYRSGVVGFDGGVPTAESGGLDACSRFAGHRRGGVTERFYILPELVDVASIL